MMFVLSKNMGMDVWRPIGYFEAFPDAVAALEEEIKKKDGQSMKIEREDDHDKDAMCDDP